MNPQTKARLDFDIEQFKARAESARQKDFSGLSDKVRSFVVAHAAFALLDQAIAEHVDYLRGRGVPIDYKRTETGFIVSLGLRRASYRLKLNEATVGITFFTASPYPSGSDVVAFATPWPPDAAKLEELDMPIRVLMEDMSAFLLNSKTPSCRVDDGSPWR